MPIRTEPTGTPALTALAAAAPHAPAAAVDHGAAIVSDLPSQPPKPATRTVSEPVAVVVKPTPAPGLPDVITHDIAGTGTAGDQWGIRSGGGSVVATVPGQPGITDQLAVQRPGAADQSVTVTLDRGGPGRVLQFQLIGTSLDGSLAPKVFALSALTLSGGQAFTAQLTPDASGITLHNAGPEVTLDLEVSTGSPTAPLPAGQPSPSAPERRSRSADSLDARTPGHGSNDRGGAGFSRRPGGLRENYLSAVGPWKCI